MDFVQVVVGFHECPIPSGICYLASNLKEQEGSISEAENNAGKDRNWAEKVARRKTAGLLYTRPYMCGVLFTYSPLYMRGVSREIRQMRVGRC